MTEPTREMCIEWLERELKFMSIDDSIQAQTILRLLRSPSTPGVEWAGYTIEEIQLYYVADSGQLCPYENHGLPGDELLCKYSDVRASLASRGQP